MEFDGFDWDWGNREKCRKHGVSIRQVEELFRGFVLVGPDARHSATEERFRAIGRTADQRGIFVAFTWRLRGKQRLIRPVSARYMHQKEVAAYEKKVSRSENG
jgi:uncharacterized DUF497 family protein